MQGDTVTAEVRGRRARRMAALSLAGGDAKSAVRFLEQSAGSLPADAPGFALLARARWEAGDVAGARAALDEALALGEPDAELQRLARAIR
jgi:predicted Zn-dependent protease